MSGDEMETEWRTGKNQELGAARAWTHFCENAEKMITGPCPTCGECPTPDGRARGGSPDHTAEIATIQETAQREGWEVQALPPAENHDPSLARTRSEMFGRRP